MYLQTPSDDFVKALCSHSLFQQQIQQLVSHHSQNTNNNPSSKMDSLSEEISHLLFQNFKVIVQQQTQSIANLSGQMRREIQKLKGKQPSNTIRQEITVKSLQSQTMSDEQQLYDLPSIRRDITEMQQRLRQVSLGSSFNFDSSDFLKQSKMREEMIQQKISSGISWQLGRVEESFMQKLVGYESVNSKKMEKMNKTITNILQTLNQLNPQLGKHQKMLNMSKSSTRLTSFFGFK